MTLHQAPVVRDTGAILTAEEHSVYGGLGSAIAEVGALVAFLASADAAYITGQTINVDGGLIMS